MLLPNLRDSEDKLAADFRNFLYVCFRALRPNHPGPTDAQYEMARFLQYGWSAYGEEVNPLGRTDLIICLRGMGKSEILACFVLWRLYRNWIDEKITVSSATSKKAKKFLRQCKYLLEILPELTDIKPGRNDMNTAEALNVAGSSGTQTPSLQAIGMTSQVTGDRATLVVNDDVEIKDNTKTEESRATLRDKTMEFENIKMPADTERGLPGGDVIYLGTPQSEESLYVKKVKENGYRIWAWPARFPTVDKMKNYVWERDNGAAVQILAPPLREMLRDNPGLHGKPAEPGRFPEEVLIDRESSSEDGRINWLLQYMLDTSVADDEKYPLKLRDLIVMSLHPKEGPSWVQWAGKHADGAHYRSDLKNYGFSGDYFVGPFRTADKYRKYEDVYMVVDTSGQGENETAWSVWGVLNGTLYCLYLNGMAAKDARRLSLDERRAGDIYDIRMEEIAKVCAKYRVNRVHVEVNFTDGLWAKAFLPILEREYLRRRIGAANVPSLEEERVVGRKETRLLDTLEPAMLNHRVVVDESVAKDGKFCYQLTRLTGEVNSLAEDDRIDCFYLGIRVGQQALALDARDAESQAIEQEFDEMLEEFIDGFHGSLRGQRASPGGLRSRTNIRPTDRWRYR